ncbi:PRC-barrel domain-containing protein [Streptomyces sp. NPDC001910]|uniref:PRC-barrel domain-containing protein n=1 Tax=Streptomyces sp. NPDC001910 TaxID=3154403 RepID=UPI003331E769
MTEFASADQLRDLTVLDPEGEKVGTVGKVYRDDADGRPEWVTVKTGLFGSKETLVPLTGARVSGSELHVPVTKETVKHAPRVDADARLDADEESDLYAHYGLTQSTSAPVGVAGTAAESGRHTGSVDGADDDRSSKGGTTRAADGRSAADPEK